MFINIYKFNFIYINIKAKIDNIIHIDRIKHPIITYEMCHNILLYSLGYSLESNNIIYPKIIDIKNHEIFNVFLKVIITNGFILYENEPYQIIHIMIDLFIRIIITMITYKDCKNVNSIIMKYKNYINLFKNNLNKDFKNKLNFEYVNFKEYSTNNIMNNYFRGLNTYINHLLNGTLANVVWV
jgi:hypothetical protein